MKHQINKDTGINGTLVDVSIDKDINTRRKNGNDKSFLDNFVDFKRFVVLENQKINQKIANLNIKDQYSQGNTLNEQQEEW